MSRNDGGRSSFNGMGDAAESHTGATSEYDLPSTGASDGNKKFADMPCALRRTDGIDSNAIGADIERGSPYNPKAAPLLFAYFPESIVFTAHEQSARILSSIGVPEADQLGILRGLEKPTFGLAFADAEDRLNKRKLGIGRSDARRWPHLAIATKSNTRTREQVFVDSIRMYLNGVMR